MCFTNGKTLCLRMTDLCAAARVDRRDAAGQGNRRRRDRRRQTDPHSRRAAGQNRPRGQFADDHDCRARPDLPEDQGAGGRRSVMDLLNNKMQEIPGVTATETLISLEQSIKKEIPICPEK